MKSLAVDVNRSRGNQLAAHLLPQERAAVINGTDLLRGGSVAKRVTKGFWRYGVKGLKIRFSPKWRTRQGQAGIPEERRDGPHFAFLAVQSVEVVQFSDDFSGVTLVLRGVVRCEDLTTSGGGTEGGF